MAIENRTLPLTGAGESTAEVAIDSTPEGDVQVVKLAVSTDGSSVLIPANLDGFFVQYRLESPQDEMLLAAALGAGVNVDLNAADITTGKIGRLLGMDIGASIPIRCDIQVVNGVRLTRSIVYTREGESLPWRPPFGSKFIELTGGAGKHFGVSITNLSAAKTADARVTVYWDEVTP